MFASYGLYVCINLETAHHRTTFGIFCNITQKITHEENSWKMFHISSLIGFSVNREKLPLLSEAQWHFFGLGSNFIWGGQKKKVRGAMGKKPKMRLIFAKFPLLSKIQNLSHNLLVRQTSNHQNCNWHAQKPLHRYFQVISSSSSWSKTTLCIFKEQIWLTNMKCYRKKANSILTRKKCSKQQRFWGCTFISFWVICINLESVHHKRELLSVERELKVYFFP